MLDDVATSEEGGDVVPTTDERTTALVVSRFSRLPDRIPPEDMVEEVPADTAKDPDFGRDPDRDWLLRTT